MFGILVGVDYVCGMKRPIDTDYSSIRDYMIAMESYMDFLEKSSLLDNFEPVDIVYFSGAVVETDEACFEASVHEKDGEKFGFSVEYTDKRAPRDTWENEYWDNENFFNGILERNADSLGSLRESKLSAHTHAVLVGFLEELKGLGWF
jgi:hypothetical protein